ncbi:hypothetical protein Hanom_Chr16g01442541 [Helianthus anomalus]
MQLLRALIFSRKEMIHTSKMELLNWWRDREGRGRWFILLEIKQDKDPCLVRYIFSISFCIQ